MVFLSFNIVDVSLQKHDFISSNLLEEGTPAPYFEAVNLDGDIIRYTDYKGKIVLLDWWYVGCKPCLKSMNDIQKIQDELGENSFTIIGMNPISKPRAIKRFRKKHNYPHEILMPEKNIVKNYHVRAYPTLYLLGANGRIVYARAGYSSDFSLELKKIIQKEISAHPTLK